MASLCCVKNILRRGMECTQEQDIGCVMSGGNARTVSQSVSQSQEAMKKAGAADDDPLVCRQRDSSEHPYKKGEEKAACGEPSELSIGAHEPSDNRVMFENEHYQSTRSVYCTASIASGSVTAMVVMDERGRAPFYLGGLKPADIDGAAQLNVTITCKDNGDNLVKEGAGSIAVADAMLSQPGDCGPSLRNGYWLGDRWVSACSDRPSTPCSGSRHPIWIQLVGDSVVRSTFMAVAGRIGAKVCAPSSADPYFKATCGDKGRKPYLLEASEGSITVTFQVMLMPHRYAPFAPSSIPIHMLPPISCIASTNLCNIPVGAVFVSRKGQMGPSLEECDH